MAERVCSEGKTALFVSRKQKCEKCKKREWAVKWTVKWAVKIEKRKRKNSGLIVEKMQVYPPLLQFCCNIFTLIISNINYILPKSLYLTLRYRSFDTLWGHSRRTTPATIAIPVISLSGISNGGYSLLSDTALIWFGSSPGSKRLTRIPCSLVAITWHLFH